MPKRLVDIDDRSLQAAKRKLGATTIKETVNRALREVAGIEVDRLEHSFDVLAAVDWRPREDAWR